MYLLSNHIVCCDSRELVIPTDMIAMITVIGPAGSQGTCSNRSCPTVHNANGTLNAIVRSVHLQSRTCFVFANPCRLWLRRCRNKRLTSWRNRRKRSWKTDSWLQYVATEYLKTYAFDINFDIRFDFSSYSLLFIRSAKWPRACEAKSMTLDGALPVFPAILLWQSVLVSKQRASLALCGTRLTVSVTFVRCFVITGQWTVCFNINWRKPSKGKEPSNLVSSWKQFDLQLTLPKPLKIGTTLGRNCKMRKSIILETTRTQTTMRTYTRMMKKSYLARSSAQRPTARDS